MPRLIHFTKVTALVIVLSVVASTLYWWQVQRSTAQLRADTLASAEMRMQQMDGMLASHVSLLLRNVDHAAQELVAEAWQRPDAEFDASAVLIARQFPVGQLRHIALLDARGQVVHAFGSGPGRASQDPRDVFTGPQQDSGDALHVGLPQRDPETGRWNISFSRAIRHSGQFDGVVVLTLSSEYLNQALYTLALHSDDTSGIFRPSGDYLARNLNPEAAIGKNVGLDRPFIGSRAGASGWFRAKSNFDHIERMFRWTRLPDYPVVVVLGFSEPALLASVEQTASGNLVQGILGTALMWLLALILIELLRQMHEQQQALMQGAAQLQAERSRMQAIYDILPTGIAIVDPQGRIVDCNPASETMLGIRRAEQIGKSIGDAQWSITGVDGQPLSAENFPATRAIRDGVSVRDTEIQVSTPQGRIWLQVHAAPLEGVGAVIAHADITQMKEAQLAATKAGSLLKEGIESIPQGFTIGSSCVSAC